MNEVFPEVEKFMGKRVHKGKIVLFPCPKCGHRTRPGKGNVERVKLYLSDELPPCRRCGAELSKQCYDRSTISAGLIERALRELGFKEVIACPYCRQRLRVPTDKGTIRVSCVKCSRKFEYVSPYRFAAANCDPR
jgi:DNA-directed RNA polymerase subunit RPC12/RpoP